MGLFTLQNCCPSCLLNHLKPFKYECRLLNPQFSEYHCNLKLRFIEHSSCRLSSGHFYLVKFEEKMLVKYVLVVQTCTVLVSSNMRQKRQCK